MCDGCDWNLSIANTLETACGRTLWTVVTAVAIPNTNTNGSSLKYRLQRKRESS